MSPEYRVLLHIKTKNGFETFGEFFIGADAQEANRLFRSLRGSDDLLDNGVLCLELREVYQNLPSDCKMMRCTLEELAENCKIIAREAFKLL